MQVPNCICVYLFFAERTKEGACFRHSFGCMLPPFSRSFLSRAAPPRDLEGGPFELVMSGITSSGCCHICMRTRRRAKGLLSRRDVCIPKLRTLLLASLLTAGGNAPQRLGRGAISDVPETKLDGSFSVLLASKKKSDGQTKGQCRDIRVGSSPRRGKEKRRGGRGKRLREGRQAPWDTSLLRPRRTTYLRMFPRMAMSTQSNSPPSPSSSSSSRPTVASGY